MLYPAIKNLIISSRKHFCSFFKDWFYGHFLACQTSVMSAMLIQSVFSQFSEVSQISQLIKVSYKFQVSYVRQTSQWFKSNKSTIVNSNLISQFRLTLIKFSVFSPSWVVTAKVRDSWQEWCFFTFHVHRRPTDALIVSN